MAKYKLTKTVVSKSNKTETTTPKIKRFTKEQAKKWVARRKAKLGSGVFETMALKNLLNFPYLPIHQLLWYGNLKR